MRVLRLFALLVAPLFASYGHAQIISVYGTFSPTHVSNVATGSVQGAGTVSEQFASNWTSNFGGGVTFGALPLGPIRLGLDVRGSTKSGTVGSDTALVGVKVGLKIPFISLKPYVQASGGYLATRTFNVSTGATPGQTFENKYAAYELLGGVDYHLVPFIDLRLVEIGGGKGYNTGIILGGASTGENATLLTVSTGVVVHF